MVPVVTTDNLKPIEPESSAHVPELDQDVRAEKSRLVNISLLGFSVAALPALVASLVEIPAVTTGAIVGAATGYQRGWEVPLDTPTSTPRHDVSQQVVVATPAPSAAASAQPVSHPSAPLPLPLPALR